MRVTNCDIPKDPVYIQVRKTRSEEVNIPQDPSLRKRRSLHKANALMMARRKNTAQQLAPIRKHEKTMLERWERDEEGWRQLPARSWPPFQPNPEQVKPIEKTCHELGCFDPKGQNQSRECHDLIFHVATCYVFYNVDPETGLDHYLRLAKEGHVDAMVACGVVLVEGLGVSPRYQEGLNWLQKAVDRGSTQACYELATVYYTGIDGVVEEDASKAFLLFEEAANEEHVGAMYMMADCLMEGEGTEVDVARAVPLLYKAAESGHRYARQTIRELLSRKTYKRQEEQE